MNMNMNMNLGLGGVPCPLGVNVDLIHAITHPSALPQPCSPESMPLKPFVSPFSVAARARAALTNLFSTRLGAWCRLVWPGLALRKE